MRIRKVTANFSFVAALLTLVLGFVLPAQSQTVLIKMGDNQTLNGTNAPSPDIHGHYWNSVDSSQFFPVLTNIDGTVGRTWAAAFGFEVGKVGNTDANNGPAGPVPPGTPANCVIDTNALGNLGIQQAVYNYYVNSEFELQNLYPSRTYTLTFFGSHSASPSDYTVYSIFTNSAYTMLETAVAEYAQYPANPSVPNSNMVVSATVLPPQNGTLYVQFLGTNTVNGGIGTNGAGGYLNCMQLTQGPSTNTPPPASVVTKTTLIQMGNTNTTHGFVTPNPDVQGHYWNSVSPAVLFPMTNAVNQINSVAYSAEPVGGLCGGFDSYNGPDSDPDGTTRTNAFSNIATNALGYLGVPTAVSDYYVSQELVFDNLDPTHQYALNFFGSIKYPASELTTYYIQNSGGSTLASPTLKVGSGQFNNEDRLATASGITGPADTVLYILFFGTNSVGNCTNGPPQYAGYLNTMSLVDLDPYPAATAPPVNATWLLNFNSTSTPPTDRGFANPSPDTLGHYWNSMDTNYYGNPVALTNAAGAATAMTVKFDTSKPAYTNANVPTRFGADSYNSPAAVPLGVGTVSSPTNAIINTNALGYLGIDTAVCQYYVNAHFILQNMNPSHQYTLTFFGSHGYNAPPDADVLTVYNVYSDTNYTSLIASTNLCVGGNVLGAFNVDRLAVIGPISPSASGAMYIDFMGSGFGGGQGNRGFLNDMQIVDVTASAATPDPFATWQSNYFSMAELGNPAYSGPNADPLGKGISNTNQFLAGFNPTNSAAYPHIISIAKANPANLVITYLGASGDSTWSPGLASRTNVLEFTTGTANGSYSSNNFISTGQTNILSGGSGLGMVTSFIETNVVTGPTRYYRVRVLVP